MNIIKELPEIFEEFAEQKKQSFLTIKEFKEKGTPIIGAYCSYFPREIAIAMGAVPVGLCSSSEETVQIAESILPKNICPLIKSSYGYAISDRCPYFHFSDLVVGETTCDGKKKMYEMMAEFKDVFVMELPNIQSEKGLELWKQEIIRLKHYLEEKFQVVITEDDIKHAIQIENRRRIALKRLYEVMKLDPVPIMGMELLDVLYGSKYKLNLEKVPKELDALTNQILEEYEEKPKKEHRPRILITGCPIGGDSKKVVKAIEDNGGVVVAFENCTGAKVIDKLVDENNPDVYDAIAKKYFYIGCAIMTPNDNRIELLGRMIDEFKVDGVVEMILSGCHSVQMESISVRNFVNEEKHIPYIDIVTDYSQGDIGQLNTRMAAFIEMLRMK
ncbi:MAG: double-cubane-cluster-containing anaerobic reductase [Lachnospiraceae bacterium]|nr:2-hydroxyacyl-CoA dehydratase family protein [Lachnospiraceae bacterium]MDY2612985.1 double-cubane-cluster-containing anaerobic reductase [Lachnospiraceae bacterium]MDY4206156.1 double-cubane-cluster-containing anaerobic reductase [Lachnospiraceae bacterium]